MSAHADETYKSLIAIANEGFKYLALCNGGAVVALLSYLGSTAGQQTIIDLRWSMISFVLGLICCGIAQLSGYLTQLALHNENHQRPLGYKHQHSLWVGFISFVASLACFGFGAIHASFRFFSQHYVIV